MTAPDRSIHDIADDEGRHDPEHHPLWNESWYLDVALPDASAGAYMRLGLSPERGVSWLLAAVVGIGPGVVMLDEPAGPMAADGATAVEAPEASMAISVLEPGRAMEVRVTADALRYPDAAAVSAGSGGEPAKVELALTWTTDGEAFRYPVGTRYEIPCAVTGRIAVDGTELALERAPGQRDHSWGARDWRAMSWCWSALHLDDGTHEHLTDLTLGEFHLTTGYLQDATGGFSVLDAAEVDTVRDPDGVPAGAHISLPGPGRELRVTSLHTAPARIETAGEAAGSARPVLVRALARVEAADGAAGAGWIEWNEPGAPYQPEGSDQPG